MYKINYSEKKSKSTLKLSFEIQMLVVDDKLKSK